MVMLRWLGLLLHRPRWPRPHLSRLWLTRLSSSPHGPQLNLLLKCLYAPVHCLFIIKINFPFRPR